MPARADREGAGCSPLLRRGRNKTAPSNKPKGTVRSVGQLFMRPRLSVLVGRDQRRHFRRLLVLSTLDLYVEGTGVGPGISRYGYSRL
jgi:hypothetical protein